MKNFSKSKLHKKLNNKISARVWISVVILIGIIAGIEIFMYHQWVNRQFEELSGSIKPFEIQKIEKGFSKETLKNTKYYIESYNQIIKLRNGEYFQQLSLDSASGLSVEVKEDKIAFGDLNKDNQDDAAVIVYSSGGGSGNFRELAVMMNNKQEPFYLASVFLGDRVKVNSIAIESEIIILDMVVHGTGDALCCPTLNKIVKYELSGNRLVEATE
jgi:hypothetical protein